MKILVTGAVGFIGSHLCERLHNLGHEVIGIDNFSSYYSLELKQLNEKALIDKDIKVLKADLNNDDLIKILPNDIDYIFHSAAQPGISKKSTFKDYLNNNVLATKALVDFALQCLDLKLFVNLGTSSVYGLEATFPETEPPKPASYYGITKLTAEQLVLQKSREKQMNSCSLRLYSVYGPRERPEKMFAKLIACGFSNEPFPLFEGSEKHLRSFTYIDDIIDGIVSVIGREDRVEGEVINLGTETEHSTQEGINTVEKVLGKKIELNIVSKRAGDQSRTKAVIEKARALLNYNPKTTLLEGIKQQIGWYRRNFL